MILEGAGVWTAAGLEYQSTACAVEVPCTEASYDSSTFRFMGI
jgi:hypothetical protein